MRRISRVVLVISVFSSACIGVEDDEMGSAEAQGFMFRGGRNSGDGGRDGGDWIINGLSDPSVCGVDPSFPLTSPQGLGVDGWLSGDDPAGEDVIHYMVECALEQDDQVSVEVPGGTLTFKGGLGLAPEWKQGPCDEECQQWISACLIARTNAVGVEVPIFVQGSHENLGFGSHEDYVHYEATFFGNVFAEPGQMHACQGDEEGLDMAEAQGRTCALDTEDCGFTIHTNCQETMCDTSQDGLLAIDCQPDPTGPSYPGITVHVAEADLDADIIDE